MTGDLLSLALENWRIFRDWEIRFHTTGATAGPHPGEPGANLHYLAQKARLETALASLQPLPNAYSAQFRIAADQPPLPPGVMAELEVPWTLI